MNARTQQTMLTKIIIIITSSDNDSNSISQLTF